MRQVSEASLREIDDLVIELQRQREKLLSESVRVQREIAEYAELSQLTMQSTKIITESLAYLNKVPDAPSMGEPHVEDNSNEEDRESGSEELAQHGEDHEALGGQVEAIESPGGPAAETPERT